MTLISAGGMLAVVIVIFGLVQSQLQSNSTHGDNRFASSGESPPLMTMSAAFRMPTGTGKFNREIYQREYVSPPAANIDTLLGRGTGGTTGSVQGIPLRPGHRRKPTADLSRPLSAPVSMHRRGLSLTPVPTPIGRVPVEANGAGSFALPSLTMPKLPSGLVDMFTARPAAPVSRGQTTQFQLRPPTGVLTSGSSSSGVTKPSLPLPIPSFVKGSGNFGRKSAAQGGASSDAKGALGYSAVARGVKLVPSSVY